MCGRGALGAADRLVEPVEEQDAVGQAGQGVVHRVVLELLLGVLAVGDVGLAADDADGAALRVAHRRPAGEHPAVGAVAVLDPELVLEVVVGAGQVRLERLGDGGAVVLVDAAEPLAGRVAELGLGVAEHLLPARREEEAVRAHVPVPQPVVGALHGERVALLGLGEPGERVLVRDRVAERVLELVEVGDVLGDAGLRGGEVDVAVRGRRAAGRGRGGCGRGPVAPARRPPSRQSIRKASCACSSSAAMAASALVTRWISQRGRSILLRASSTAASLWTTSTVTVSGSMLTPYRRLRAEPSAPGSGRFAPVPPSR